MRLEKMSCPGDILGDIHVHDGHVLVFLMKNYDAVMLFYQTPEGYTMCPVDTATAGSWAGVGLVN
jgi:hypothetical protein